MLVWFLLAPPDTADGAWVILGMYEAPEACEQARLARQGLVEDRPYKPAVSRERALDIMKEEVKEGQLDADLFRLFTEAKVFESPHQ